MNTARVNGRPSSEDEAELNHRLEEGSLPPDLHDLAHAVLACPGSAAVLHLLASHRFGATTLADLAYLSREPEKEARHALDVLESQGLVERLEMTGQVYYQLTQDEGSVARISEFLKWRKQWIDRAQGVIRDMDADRQSQVLVD